MLEHPGDRPLITAGRCTRMFFLAESLHRPQDEPLRAVRVPIHDVEACPSPSKAALDELFEGVVELVLALAVEDSREAKVGQPVDGCPRQGGGLGSAGS